MTMMGIAQQAGRLPKAHREVEIFALLCFVPRTKIHQMPIEDDVSRGEAWEPASEKMKERGEVASMDLGQVLE